MANVARDTGSVASYNKSVPPVTFEQAREIVLSRVRAALQRSATESASLESAAGRVLAEDVAADRDCPPLDRSVRDGYAVRSSDVPGKLRLAGEVRAGQRHSGSLGPGDAVSIMTGAPIPEGADAVIMIEHTSRENGWIRTEAPATPRQFINPRGCEAVARQTVLRSGKRLDYTDIAMLASFGHASVQVFARPVVAILPTGDEIVELDQTPRDFEIRNSNAYSLAVQVARAGGVPRRMPVARDTVEETRRAIEIALGLQPPETPRSRSRLGSEPPPEGAVAPGRVFSRADLLLLSGGVSAGKYDVVEQALADLGAEFYFDRALIQPGQPVVFGKVASQFFFGLPGNPSSTTVTFEIFARAALELLGGQEETMLPITWARLTRDFRHRAGLTRFLPARLSGDGELTPVEWQGSGDVPALTRANAFLVADPERPEYKAGEWIRVLLK